MKNIKKSAIQAIDLKQMLFKNVFISVFRDIKFKIVQNNKSKDSLVKKITYKKKKQLNLKLIFFG